MGAFRVALFAFFFLFLSSSTSFAQIERINEAFQNLCNSIYLLFPPVAMLLIILSAVVYGVGQLFGAEMRARATMWATTMMVGTVMGALIMLITPSAISFFTGSSVPCGHSLFGTSRSFSSLSVTFGGGGVYTISATAPGASSISIYVTRGTPISGPTEPWWPPRTCQAPTCSYTSGANIGTPLIWYATATFPDGTTISSGIRGFSVQ
ncbi:MAG: hypothetical protein N3G22_02000 [Candidatus Micrarchaeota archaeon]|nr:hypothetical protein [Candidatus Micrarchaeota archaeon]